MQSDRKIQQSVKRLKLGYKTKSISMKITTFRKNKMHEISLGMRINFFMEKLMILFEKTRQQFVI